MKNAIFCGFITVILSNTSIAAGNHPTAGACSSDKPYFAICTHSLHSLEGWYGKHCYKDRAAAQAEAEHHAARFHKKNMRWTGVNNFRGMID